MTQQKLSNQQIHTDRKKRKHKRSRGGRMLVPEEQIAYAKMIKYGSLIGIAMLSVTFLAYIFGVVPGNIQPHEVAHYWHLSSEQFISATGTPSGWAWLGMLEYGNFLSILGIAWLASLTIIGYLAFLVPAYFKKKDTAFLTIAVVEVAVLVVAASGILGSVGH
ncbi:hypothetical protein [Desulfofalx alkaliphila]|uniref:hypothetical protein n=1 Tax=Desulfofalx alkaliphila TaxID=105483 RepID=UPI00068F4F4E|nr:hypothetical protein [Desulfofalx alkaliphila]